MRTRSHGQFANRINGTETAAAVVGLHREPAVRREYSSPSPAPAVWMIADAFRPDGPVLHSVRSTIITRNKYRDDEYYCTMNTERACVCAVPKGCVWANFEDPSSFALLRYPHSTPPTPTQRKASPAVIQHAITTGSLQKIRSFRIYCTWMMTSGSKRRGSGHGHGWRWRLAFASEYCCRPMAFGPCLLEAALLASSLYRARE